MTDNSAAQLPALNSQNQPVPPNLDGLDYARHMEKAYGEAVAYARNLEKALADYQKGAARGAEHIHMLESELAKLQQAQANSRPGSSQDLDYTRHLEQAHTQTLTYVKTLENAVSEYQAASIRSAEYVKSL